MKKKKMNFTDGDKKLLKFIYSCGGYTKAKNVEVALEIEYRNTIRKLRRLVDMEYLTKFKLNSNSDREPNIYKVTKKACRFFNNDGSYKRKKHNEEYINKMLVLNSYLATIYKDLEENIYYEPQDKFNFLELLGYNKKHFPVKFGNSYYIEEILISKCDNKHMDFSSEYDVTFLYTDDFYTSIDYQIKNIIERYSAMLEGSLRNVQFNIITADENRMDMYVKHINKIFSRDNGNAVDYKPNKKYPDTNYVLLYLTFLTKYCPERYLSLENQLRLHDLNNEDIVIRVKEKIFNSPFTPNESRMKIANAMEYSEFTDYIKPLIAKGNYDEVLRMFFATFMVQMYPDILKFLSNNDLDAAAIGKYNFNIVCAEK